MSFIELTVGIAIGFGLGVLIMIFFDTSEHNSFNNFVEIEDFDDQIHESGFIDIPARNMIPHSYHTPLEQNQFKKRIRKFKNRNRFYR